MVDEISISPEVMLTPEHRLGGAILVHGFVGNTDKSEIHTLAQIITRGAIISPSKRSLTPKEEARTLFDRKRIAFHTWKPERLNSIKYVGQAVWAAPVTALEGTIVGDDMAMEEGDIFAYNPAGVDIPLQRGLLFVSDDMLDNSGVQAAISERANKEVKAPEEWVVKNVVIVPKEAFKQPDELLKIISRRIRPSDTVTADFVTRAEFDENLKIYFLEEGFAQKHTTADVKDLGNGVKVDGEYISPEMVKKWDEDTSHYNDWFDKISLEMEFNLLPFEELRPPEDGDKFEGFWKLRKRVEKYLPGSDMAHDLDKMDQKRAETMARYEKILFERYPNAPEFDVEPESPGILVWRKKGTREIRLHKPL